jgi:hypothetical protein
MDVKEIEKAAKIEALGWIELNEEPVPITVAGCKRTLKRAVLGFAPAAAVFAVLGLAKVLGWMPVPPV